MEILTYPIANDIDFDFSTLPDSHEVVIRRGSEIYRGSIEDIPHLSLEKDELLDFEISASYNPGSNTSYYGTVTYRFRMRVVEAAKFQLDRLSTTVGDYILLSCQNVKNEQKLEIAGEPALPAAPVIFKRGETVYAMIPTLQTGTQQITVTYGSISDTFALSVTPNASATEHVYTSEQLRNWPSDLLQELNRRIEERGALTDNGQPLFGHFEAYDASVAERILAFGDTLTVNGASPVTVPFELYKMSTEHHVTALSYGVVREVGEDAVFGQYVIIDHGGGLYSHYYGLTAIQVQQQQSVGGGDELGLASTTGIGLAGERNVLILTTLGKTAISPDFLRTHGLDLE